MLIEVILQVLISIIDAELLEAVAAKVLEAKDVQHPYRLPLMLTVVLLGQESLVDLQHNPVKQRAVHTLGHGVSGGDGLRGGHRLLSYIDIVI